MEAWKRVRAIIKQGYTLVFVNYLLDRQGGSERCPTIVTFEERNIDMLEAYTHKHPDRVFFLRKNTDDGSQVICEMVPTETIQRFEIVGVNTEHCVIDTAIGLACRMPNKEIVIWHKGCNSNPLAGRSQEEVLQRVACNIIGANVNNISIESDSIPTGRIFSSYLRTTLSHRYKRALISWASLERENAFKRKAGPWSNGFRDTSIMIAVLDDQEAEEMLFYYRIRQVKIVKLRCRAVEMNQSEFFQTTGHQKNMAS